MDPDLPRGCCCWGKRAATAAAAVERRGGLEPSAPIGSSSAAEPAGPLPLAPKVASVTRAPLGPVLMPIPVDGMAGGWKLRLSSIGSIGDALREVGASSPQGLRAPAVLRASLLLPPPFATDPRGLPLLSPRIWDSDQQVSSFDSSIALTCC